MRLPNLWHRLGHRCLSQNRVAASDTSRRKLLPPALLNSLLHFRATVGQLLAERSVDVTHMGSKRVADFPAINPELRHVLQVGVSSSG